MTDAGFNRFHSQVNYKPGQFDKIFKMGEAMIDQKREQLLNELEALQDCHDGGARFEFCLGCLADWHLKDKETALAICDAKWRKEMADEIVADRKKYETFYEARGMKKAAESIIEFLDIGEDPYMLDEIQCECGKIIEEANKTIEAEGEEKK